MNDLLKSSKRTIDVRQVLLMVLATGACLGLAVLGGILAIFTPLVFDRSGNLLNPVAWLGFLDPVQHRLQPGVDRIHIPGSEAHA